ncbi:hypothetical protein KXD40_008324 [Peronospora effusa]|uniref:Ubiquitin-like domain-containing protein n=1 Tax=Peronospora effusa TaxID=542832 RepID=A0A3M6VB46_9STRA|nr:hypothetical protein DD238_005893 [Peronospora effusa]UIZ24104.1 hypothetical protein KXD40_008324 [Peronospora effusa]
MANSVDLSVHTPPDSPVSTSSLPFPPSSHNDALHLRLKTLDERVFDVTVASSMSVTDFRATVAEATAVPAPRQRLIYRGKLLKDGAALAAYDLQDGHTVHLVAKPPAAVEADASRRPADGPAWNLANLRSALRRTGASTTSIQQLPVLREVLAETAESTEEQEPILDLEPITQGILTMRTVLSTAQREQQRQFFVGQWLDVKDTVNQWLEATVMDIADGKVLVHYHGWPTRWNEWIDFDSDRIAAFRTRTLHTQNPQRMSPVPTMRVPSAPQVGGRDVRCTVIEVRNLMREMMPHIDQLADLCEEDVRRQQQQREERAVNVTVDDASDSSTIPVDRQARDSEVSEVAHLVAPLFDRFGRLLMDSVQYLDPLLYPELRSTSQRQQERRSTALRRGHEGSSQRRTASVSTSMGMQDNSFSIRDLITTSSNLASESNQPRRSIDVHIHAIVAPASLSSLALLTRGNNNGGSSPDTGVSLQMPSTPPIGRSFGFNDTRNSDSRVSDDEGDHSRVPLLGSYRHRSHSQVSDSSRHQQQRAVSRDLDDFLSNDFFGASFSHNDDDSDDESSVSYAHSDVMQSGRSVDRPPSFSGRISSPGTPSDDDSAQNSSGTIGAIPEITTAEEQSQSRASGVASPSNEDGEDGHNGRLSHASAESSSSNSSSGFPTFLEVMRRTLSGVRSFVHNEQSSSLADGTSNQLGLVSGFLVPSSSSSSLSTPPVSPVIRSSIENVTIGRRGSSENSFDEALDLDEVD